MEQRQCDRAESPAEFFSRPVAAAGRENPGAVSELGHGRPFRSQEALVGARERLLEHPAVYAAWQAPFAAQKFAPVERRLRDRAIRRVLDAGCGTGTHARRLERVEEGGGDVTEQYLAAAQ